MRLYRFGYFVQSLLYLGSGVNHFWHEAFYRHLMPDHYHNPGSLVRISGVAELLAGAGLLFRVSRRLSAIGIILMLLVFLDVHQFMLRHPERFPEIAPWILWARFPLQLVLIGCAWVYARRRQTTLEH